VTWDSGSQRQTAVQGTESSTRSYPRRRDVVSGLATFGLSTLLKPAAAQSQRATRIDVHHHILPPKYMAELARLDPAEKLQPWWKPELSIEDMDKNGVATAVVSLTQPAVWFDDIDTGRRLARESNDYAAGLVKDHPGRFRMFGALSLPDTEGSLNEIEYVFGALKADGICLMTSYGERYLGDAAFWPVYEELNRRRAVIYTHPLTPKCCKNPLPQYLRDSSIELGTDTTRTIASLLFSGTAAKFPNIRWIFSHAGGTMPFLYQRFVREAAAHKDSKSVLPNGLLYEIKKFYYDLAQSTVPGTVADLLSLVPVSQLLLGSDYPARSAAEVIAGINKYGFSADEVAAIEHGNARRLLPNLPG
jgi:predicted TIM-barrel fold metal-dependent hydrolase